MTFRNLAVEELAEDMVALLGVPWDEKSSHIRGAAEAPAAVRAYRDGGAANWSSESLRNLWTADRFVDVGDVKLSSGEPVLDEITSSVDRALSSGARLICVGGDHAIVYPIIRAYASRYPGLSILQIDAHPDLYDELGGDRYSHACPFARIMEEGLVQRLVQVGIRANTSHQQEHAERFGVEMIDMRSWRGDTNFNFDGPLYVSLDLDGIDPGSAPGVAHPEGGGLSARDVLRILQRVNADLVGADVVEFIPRLDVNGITAALAWKLVKELADRMLVQSGP